MTFAAYASLLLAAAALGLATFLAAQRRRTRLLLRRWDDQRLTQLGEAERAAREAEAEAGRASGALRSERDLERQLVHDRDTARKWNRELRRQLLEAQKAAGLLGDPGNPRDLVLRVAIELLGAQKGLMLAHDDDDGDGDLDLVAAQGFDRDPDHSPVVQELARRTLSAQETVRLNDPRSLADGIENLVAIPIYMRDHFHGVIVAANKPGGFDDYDDDLLLALGDHAGIALENMRLQGRLRGAYVATVRVLAEAIEAKDPFLRGHCDEVSSLVAAVATKLDLGPRKREELIFASLLHDIGKIGISERILLKPGPLTSEERTIVELHPRIGYRLVEQVPDLRPVGLAVLHHHERWDGNGYPTGLKGEAIPLEARVIAIADAFSAMISERPYGVRLSPLEACEELRACAGEQFDPELVGIFCEEVSRREGAFEPDGVLDRALDDPELQQLRDPAEPLLGAVAYASVDNTTLLYSHRHLQEQVRSCALAARLNGRPFSVAVVELVDLERINQVEGYAAGDAALNEVARELERIAVGVDGLAARLSGRRLALLLPGVDEASARVVLDDVATAASVRITCAAWQDGDGGEAVVDRARQGERLARLTS